MTFDKSSARLSAYRLVLLASAESELLEAVAWYRERSLSAAQNFVLEFEAKVQLILDSPTRWAIFEADTRRVVLNRFPYSVVYRVQNNDVAVIALMHHRREPRYWSAR